MSVPVRIRQLVKHGYNEKTHHFDSVILLFAPSESRKTDNIFHIVLNDWVTISLKCTENEHFKGRQLCWILRDLIIVFSKRENILEWTYIVRSVGFGHACFWFFLFCLILKTLTLNSVNRKSCLHFERVRFREVSL